jgi:hypothetical protein
MDGTPVLFVKTSAGGIAARVARTKTAAKIYGDERYKEDFVN